MRLRTAMTLSLLILVGFLLLYPLGSMVTMALTDRGRWSFYWLSSVAGDVAFRLAMLRSLALATLVTLLALAVAFPLAWLQVRGSFPLRRLLGVLILAPMVLPPFVGALGIRQILGRFGSLSTLLAELGVIRPELGLQWQGGFWTCALLMALGLYPVVYLNLQASLEQMDPSLLEAAENLGSPPWRNFWRITLPLTRPGLLAGGTIVFIWAFTELGTPLLLDYRGLVSRSLFDEVSAHSPAGYAKGLLVLSVSLLAYLLGRYGLGQTPMASKALVASRRLTMGWPATFAFVFILILATLPHLGVIAYSLTAMANEPGSAGWGDPAMHGWYRTVLPTRWTLAGYREVLTNPDIYRSFFNSLRYATLATGANLCLGVAIAWSLVRGRGRGAVLLDTLVMMPLAIPGLVMAFGFLALASWKSLSFLSPDRGTWPWLILVLAYALRRLPYLVRSAVGGFEQTSVTLEEAGLNLGASPLRVFAKITLPLLGGYLAAGAILTFSFTLLEVSDSLILAPLPRAFPLTKQIYVMATDTSAIENLRNAAALGVLAMGAMLATLLAASYLMGRRLARLF